MLMFRFLQLEAYKAELYKACLMAANLGLIQTPFFSCAEFNSCIVRKATFDQCNKFSDHGLSRFSISENFRAKRLFFCP